jgi:biopolymer transport protein ExbB/TolQ
LELILNAGPVVKAVLAILLYFSLVSWAIIFYKLAQIYRAIKASDRFLEFSAKAFAKWERVVALPPNGFSTATTPTWG